jgi:hypothetical protein
MYNRSPIPAQFTADNAASEKQIAWVRDLVATREMPASWRERAEHLLDIGPTKPEASKMITAMKDLPRKAQQQDEPHDPAFLAAAAEAMAPRTQQPRVDVPAGRYAVDTEAGHLAFYRVDRPTDGKWAGYTFVKVQASDELHPVRGGAAKAVLAKIAVDPTAAMLRYGQEIGKCGHCGRTLTDETSRELGIGPVCRAQLGL